MPNQRRVGAPNDPNHLGVVIDSGAGPLDIIAPGGINIDGVPLADAVGSAPADFVQTGTSPLERWYSAPMVAAAGTPTTGAPNLNVMVAFPFSSTRGGTLDRVGIQVTTPAAGGVATVAVYGSTSEANLYPAALVLDAGEVSTAAGGLQTLTVNLVLEPATLYWFVYWPGTLAATVRCLPMSMVPPIFGFDNTLATFLGVGVQLSRTYAATCPDPFPAGGSVINGTPLPVIGLRFAA